MNAHEHLGALVLNEPLEGESASALAYTAMERGLGVVIVHSPRFALSPPLAGLRCFAAPYAGFQIIEALAELLADRRST